VGAAQTGDGDSSDNVTTATTERGTWMIEYPRDALPTEPLDRTLWWCFLQNARSDEANAALHCSQVRYSPLTFRIADQLDAMNIYDGLAPEGVALLRTVFAHRGTYAEDPGRAG
jgi:hypothetical protein